MLGHVDRRVDHPLQLQAVRDCQQGGGGHHRVEARRQSTGLNLDPSGRFRVPPRALFGSGGFLYAIYLAGRIADKERIRVTQSTLIGLSTLTRLILFAVAGVYSDGEVALTALLLAPAMLLGTFAGRHITLKLTRAQFLVLVNVVILVSGVSLLVRYFS